MDADPKLSPAVALLRELDNLSVQLRSMEPKFQQAQARSEEKLKQLQQTITELERVRYDKEGEIATLRQETERQRRALTERGEAVTAVELALHGKIQELQQDLARLRSELEKSDAEARDWRLKAADAVDLEQRLTAKIDELRLQVAERQLLVDSRATAIAELQLQVARLLQPKQAAIDHLDHANETERKPMNDDANRPLTQLEPSRTQEQSVEQTLHDEIDRLRREAQERNQILRDRNDELVRVKAEYDRLHERVDEIESATSRAERVYSDEAERMRIELQAQIALLQAELSQKEWAIEERQAEARGREQNLLQEIESLRRQLTENKTGKQPEPDDFVLGEPRANSAQEQRFELAGHAAADHEHNGFASHRRWQTGFGWKRRWRS